MAYVTTVDDQSTNLSLTTERFLRVSSRYLFASVQPGPVLVSEYSDNDQVDQFVDPPAFRSVGTQGSKSHMSQACHLELAVMNTAIIPGQLRILDVDQNGTITDLILKVLDVVIVDGYYPGLSFNAEQLCKSAGVANEVAELLALDIRFSQTADRENALARLNALVQEAQS